MSLSGPKIIFDCLHGAGAPSVLQLFSQTGPPSASALVLVFPELNWNGGLYV